MEKSNKMIEVCAAIIRHCGNVLLATRPKGKHLEDFWEFPGGKLEQGETHELCLKREIKEELGCSVSIFDSVYKIEHRYSDRDVRIYFYRTFLNDAELITPQEQQRIKWFTVDELLNIPIVAADAPLINFLKIGEGR
jgi:mutator protein MutT